MTSAEKSKFNGDIFILGAGFSKAVSSNMPTLKELSFSLSEQIDSLFLPGQAPDDKIKCDIERFLSYLGQDYPWLGQALQLRNRAAFLELSQMIGNEIKKRQATIKINDLKKWFQELIQLWYYERMDVITFNYDILIELFASSRVFNGLDVSDMYPVTLSPARTRSGRSVVDSDKIGKAFSFSLYKLHGSLNYFYSGSQEYFGEPIYLQYEHYSEFEPALMGGDVSDKVPLIVPPTIDKTSFFRNETIRKIWQQASAVQNNLTLLN